MILPFTDHSSKECQFRLFFLHIAVFHESGSSPLNSFNIVTMLLSMWVPYAAGVLETGTNKGDVCLTFNTLGTGRQITSNEAKGMVGLDNLIPK